MQRVTKMRGTKTMTTSDYTISPFTILIDTREQAPYSFRGFLADANRDNAPLVVPVKTATLQTGDYSIDTMKDQVAVERKSLSDLYGTIGQGRERFERELVRLDDMEFAAVVIEAGWSAIIGHPPTHSELRPKTVYRSIIAWQQRYPRVHWWACDTRTFAERTTLRILQRFWTDHQ
jgi:ERCC4-type nuclease